MRPQSLYEACEDNDCKYAIRLKENQVLRKLVADAEEALLPGYP